MNSNIDDKVPSKNNLLQFSKPNASAFQPEKAILLLSRLFNNSIRAINSNDNNLNIFQFGNSLFKLLPNIMSNNLSNFLLNFDNHKL